MDIRYTYKYIGYRLKWHNKTHTTGYVYLCKGDFSDKRVVQTKARYMYR